MSPLTGGGELLQTGGQGRPEKLAEEIPEQK